MVEIAVTDAPNEELDEFIRSNTRTYNSGFVPNDFEYLSVYGRSDQGELIGGLTAKTYWDYLDIEFLWVDERHRQQGIATVILRRAEDEAMRRGCTRAALDTFQFQALGFYRKLGYEIFGTLDGYCGKYQRYYLTKTL